MQITLDYPHEFITGVTGKYQVPRCGGTQHLRSITFVTNKLKYGPMEVSLKDQGHKDVEFEYNVGKQFGGFFGNIVSDGLENIGVYLKPLDKLPINPVKKE